MQKTPITEKTEANTEPVIEHDYDKPDMEVTENCRTIDQEFEKLSLNQEVNEKQNSQFMNYMTYLDILKIF